jgi:hypothetical protein
MIEEASQYNQGMQQTEAASTADNASQLAASNLAVTMGQNQPTTFVRSGMFQHAPPHSQQVLADLLI